MQRVRVLRCWDGPTVEPGPLIAYQTMFPHRYVVWNRERAIWEIRQRNPLTQQDERYELLFEGTDEEGRKKFRPFDHKFVGQRRADLYRFLHNNLARLSRARREKIREISERIAREAGEYMKDGFTELKRWLPVIATYHERGVWWPDERVPLVTGANLER